MLPIAPSTFYEHTARRRDPSRRSARERSDVVARGHVRRVWQDNHQVYGVRKVYKQLQREGVPIAKCTVRRLMRQMGLRGAVRGRRFKTTVGDPNAARPPDGVDRDFTAIRPNQLWVSDLTYVATWSGFVYVAFVVDVFSRAIVGWRASASLRTDLAIDALEQAIYNRLDGLRADELIAHSDPGSQYLSIRYTERLADAGIEPSVGTVGDSYDNALAETIIGLYKTEVIRHQGPWRNLDEVEFATLTWVHWFNTTRLLEPIGDIPPYEYEQLYRQIEQATPADPAGVN